MKAPADPSELALDEKVRQAQQMWRNQYGQDWPPVHLKSAAHCFIKCARAVGLTISLTEEATILKR